jgi:IS1 family transposase
MFHVGNINILKGISFVDFHSIIEYRIIFWGISSNGRKIFTLQKKINRLIVGAHPRTPCRSLFNKLAILPVSCESIFSFMHYFFSNKVNIQTNSSVSGIHARNKHHIHRPFANLSCFQNSAFYSDIRIFSSLPRSLTNLKNGEAQFKGALKRHVNMHSFSSVDIFLCVQTA